MCGRYDNAIARDAYRGLFKAQRIAQSNFPPRYNIAPPTRFLIFRIDPRDGEREVVMGAMGADPILDEGEAKGSAHQREGRDRR